MRSISIAITLSAAALLAAACSASQPTAGSTASRHSSCSGVSGKHHAYVVVVHGDGRESTSCVGFDQGSLSGDSLMRESLVEYRTQSTQYGPAVCQVDTEPAHYDKCLPAAAPYWASWQWNGSAWAMATTAYSVMKFTDGEALGWVYTPPTGSPAPPPPPPAA